MPSLKGLTRTKSNRIPGTKAKLYFTFFDEITSWPQTKEQLGGSNQGDSKIFGEAWDFTAAPTGKGFWREVDILVDTGALNDTLEGEVGGHSIVNRLPFFLEGAEAAQREFFDQMVANEGCVLWMIGDKNGNYPVLGNKDFPAYLETGEGGTGTVNGDRVGYSFQLFCNTGLTAMLYDVTLGIDLTPNT